VMIAVFPCKSDMPYRVTAEHIGQDELCGV